jgi:hypothetical protein
VIVLCGDIIIALVVIVGRAVLAVMTVETDATIFDVYTHCESDRTFRGPIC